MQSGILFNGCQLTLVTLNCFGVPFVRHTRARLTTIAQQLDSGLVDVVCLQEVWLSTYVLLLDQELSRFPYVAFEPFLYGPRGGLLTFSRQPIEETNFWLYSKRGWLCTLSLADRLLHKGVLATKLTRAGQRIIVLNTHLTANYSGDWSPSNRYARLEQAQLQRLATVVNELDADSILIIAGDLNIPRHSWLYDEFVEATRVIDPLAGNTKPTYYPVFPLPSRYRQPIDHVFVRLPAGCELTATAELLLEDKVPLSSGHISRVSDHAGIHLKLRWREPAFSMLGSSSSRDPGGST